VPKAVELCSCFISYSHADKSFARRLRDQLQGRGIRCWLDEKQILPGDDIYEQVDHGIKLRKETPDYVSVGSRFHGVGKRQRKV
jgi:hypothetical protein